MEENLEKRVVSAMMLTLLLVIDMLTLACNIQPVEAGGTICIRPDGSIDPPTAPIQRDGDVYTFTDNIYDEIVVERSNIAIDGNGYTLHGIGDGYGFFLSGIDSVTIQNTNIDNFVSGVKLYESFFNSVSDNNITNNYYGISLPWSSGNSISGNRITANTYDGIELWASSHNSIRGNIITDNDDGVGLSSSSNNNTISGNKIADNWDNGVYIGGSSYNNVNGNNKITDNGYGIQLSGSSHTTISNNNMIGDDIGIEFEDSSDNIIYGNNITNARYGILSDTSDNNILSENNITNNRSYGIEESYGVWLFDSSNDTLFENMLNGYNYSFYVTGDNVIHHMHSIDVSNLVDGKPVYYLVNQKDLVISPSTYPEIGYMAVINSTNIMVEGLNLMNNGQGLLLAYTENSRIAYNNITNNNYGVYLRGCSNNTISGNKIRNNSEGVYLRRHPLSSDKSSNNTVSRNNITDNFLGVEISASSYNDISNNNIINNVLSISLFVSRKNTISHNNMVNDRAGEGIHLWGSSHNIIFDNNIINNDRYGIWLSEHSFFGGSSNNSIFHNNFINNTDQVWVSGEHSNVWDDGYPSGGNYWDDYCELDTDDDGIGDTPYVIDADNQDRYPLVVPLGSIPIVWDETIYPVELKGNSTISRFQFNASQKMISFNVTGPDGTLGFCNLTIPNSLVKDLWQGNYIVLVDEEEPLTMNEWADGTYTYVYFTYVHSPHEVTIIQNIPPQPPFWMQWWLWAIVAVVIVALAGAVYFSKKRKPPTTQLSPESTEQSE